MKSMLVSFIELAAAVAVLMALSVLTAFGAADDGAEFPLETEALLEATTAFFNAVERTDEARSTPAIRIPELAHKIKGLGPETGATSLTRNGPVRHLTGYRINWYPVDRFLGSVDFMGTWDGNRNLVCGYLTWDLTQPEAPVLHTVIANFIDLNSFDGKSSADIHQMLLESNCAFGAVDANYAFFEPARR